MGGVLASDWEAGGWGCYEVGRLGRIEKRVGVPGGFMVSGVAGGGSDGLVDV